MQLAMKLLLKWYLYKVLSTIIIIIILNIKILLCAWRTVKEVSLILGDVCLKAPIKSEISMVGLITQDQIFSIGDRFVLLLSQLKHRGAFEQAFVGKNLKTF